MSEPLQTDVSRPSALATANLRNAQTKKAAVDQNSEEYLEQIEDEWNKKVDVEVETLVDGMVDLVSLASVSNKILSVPLYSNDFFRRLLKKISSKSRKKPFKPSRELNLWYVP